MQSGIRRQVREELLRDKPVGGVGPSGVET
jgi:hypothetical protein